MPKIIGFLIAVGYLVLSVFLIWSGHVYEDNWLLGTPSAWTIQAGTVFILVVYAVFGAFVGYMRMRERRESESEWIGHFGPPGGPGEQAPAEELTRTGTVLPFAPHRPPPPTQPIPQAPAARASGDVP